MRTLYNSSQEARPISNFDNRNNPRNTGNNRTNTRAQSEIPAEEVPIDYVEAAEKIMLQNTKNITTSKIRKILAMIMDIYNAENLRSESEITSESAAKLQMMRVRTIYECGREKGTKLFFENVKILNYLKGIGKNREMLMRFTHYLEALVAYHKYYGGREG